MARVGLTPIEEYQPGHPIDLRPAAVVAKLAEAPLSDFERMAARVVARFTGEEVYLQDDGSRPGMPDIRVEYADGHTAYVEVWTDIQADYAETYSQLRRRGKQLPLDLSFSSLKCDWFLTISGSTKLDALELELESLLARAEALGISSDLVTSLGQLDLAPNSSVRRLRELGVVELASRPAVPQEPGTVRLYPEGITGPSVVSWPPVLDWIKKTLGSQRLEDVRAKLARTRAAERHLFIGLSFTSPGEVYFALSAEERTLPPVPPDLPTEITHLWLMNAPLPGRCLAFLPERGWLDPAQHWETD